MKLITRALPGAVAVFVAFGAIAYNNNMHTAMSDLAAANSKVSGGDLLVKWGLTSYSYPYSKGGERFITDLIVAGATDEDSPNGRVLNHFYDPLYRIPLSICGVIPIFNQSSPDWAIRGAGQSEPVFSYATARKAMRDAFISARKTDRDAKMGLMFETLGHVIHHLQDMAQPQHVRNDAHQFVDEYPDVPEPIFNRSRYETWAEGQAGSIEGAVTPVFLPKPQDYWARDGQPTVGMASYTNFNFVSDGSNFKMSNGVVVSNSRYSDPQPLPTSPNVDIVDIRAELGCPMRAPENPNPTSRDPRCSLDGTALFVQTNVYDVLTAGSPFRNPRAAMYSIFDRDLQQRGVTFVQENTCIPYPVLAPRIFTVNELTFPYAFSFLGPRAVDYSAGMLDYFVRGDIDLKLRLPDFRLEIRNNGTERVIGTVALYYDDAEGNRYPVQDGSWTIDLGSGAVRYADRFAEPVNPEPEVAGRYVMVFTGTMGEEVSIDGGPGAVVAKIVDLPGVEFYWSNNSGCVGCNIQMPEFPPFIGSAGGAELSFMVPPSWDQYISENKDRIKVKIGGVDYPALPPSPEWTCQNQFLYDRPRFGMEMFNNSIAIVPSWQGLLSPGGFVEFTNPEYVPSNWLTLAPFFFAYKMLPGGVNSFPVCANQLKIFFPSPGGKTAIEYLVGDVSLFKFCIKEEISDWESTGGFTTVLSKLVGARLAPGAYKMRVDRQDTQGCFGNN